MVCSLERERWGLRLATGGVRGVLWLAAESVLLGGGLWSLQPESIPPPGWIRTGGGCKVSSIPPPGVKHHSREFRQLRFVQVGKSFKKILVSIGLPWAPVPPVVEPQKVSSEHF